MKHDTLAVWLAKYFDQYLIQQRRLSRHTLLSYRDCWKLLLNHVCQHTGKSVERLAVDDVRAEVINGFLSNLNEQRSNRVSTRNVRLAAIRSFFRWLSMTDPTHIGVCNKVLNIPKANGPRKEVRYLERDELDALFAAIPTDSPSGVRNYTLMALMYNTGARVQEVLDLRIRDVQTERPYMVKLLGKGAKERICVLWPETADWVRKLIKLRACCPGPEDRLFENRLGVPMTRHGVRYVLQQAAQTASKTCAALKEKPLHPHVLRHTAAMHMLQSGVDVATIQSILGHMSSDTTSRYAKANLAMKQAALEKCEPLTRAQPAVWKKDSDIMAFLSSL